MKSSVVKKYVIRDQIQSLKLCFAHGHDQDLFSSILAGLNSSEIRELQRHTIIKLNFTSQLKLFILKNILCFCKSSKKHKLSKIYDRGKLKIENALDIVGLIQDIQEMKTYLHTKLVDKSELFLVEHQNDNLIHFDDNCSESSIQEDVSRASGSNSRLEDDLTQQQLE